MITNHNVQLSDTSSGSRRARERVRLGLVVAIGVIVVAVGASCDRDRTAAQANPGVPGNRSALAVDSTRSHHSRVLDGTSTCDTLVRLVMVPSMQLLTVARDTALRVPMSDALGWRRGCVIAMTDSTDGAPTQPLEQWFTSHGWVYAPYSADGPDGTVFGYTDFHRVCVVRGSWDGGDDSDTTIVPAPGYELTVMCAPSTPEDSAGYGKRHREELERQDALKRPRVGGAIVRPVPAPQGKHY